MSDFTLRWAQLLDLVSRHCTKCYKTWIKAYRPDLLGELRANQSYAGQFAPHVLVAMSLRKLSTLFGSFLPVQSLHTSERRRDRPCPFPIHFLAAWLFSAFIALGGIARAQTTAPPTHSRDDAMALLESGRLTLREGRPAAALPILRDGYTAVRKEHGSNSEVANEALCHLWEAYAWLERDAEITDEMEAECGRLVQALGPSHSHVLRIKSCLAFSLYRKGHFELARTQVRDLVALLEANDQVSARIRAQILTKAGSLLSPQDERELIEAVLHKAVKLGESISEEPALAADAHASLGDFYLKLGDLDAALLHFEKALELFCSEEKPDLLSIGVVGAILIPAIHLAHGTEASIGKFFLLQEYFARRNAMGEYQWVGLVRNLSLGLSRNLQEHTWVHWFDTACHEQELRSGPESPELDLLLDSYAVRLIRTSKWDTAASVYESLWTLRQARLGKSHRLTLQAMSSLGYSLHRAKRRGEGIQLLQEAVALIGESLGEEDEDYFKALSWLAAGLSGLRRHIEAEPILRKIITHDERGPIPHQSYGQWVTWLADSVVERDPSEALSLHRRAATRLLNDPTREPREAFQQQVGIMKAMVLLGELEDAHQLLLDLEKLRQDPTISKEVSPVRLRLSYEDALAAAGHLEVLSDVRLETLRLARAHPGKSGIDLYLALRRLGTDNADRKRDDIAEEFFRESLDVAIQQMGEENALVTSSLLALGATASRIGDNEEALRYYLQALELEKRTMRDSGTIYARLLRNIGQVYVERREYDAAIGVLEEAVVEMKRGLGRLNDETAEAHQLLGRSYRQSSKHAEAVAHTEEAISIYREIRGDRDLKLAKLYSNCGWSHSHVGNRAEAERLYRLAIELYESTQDQSFLEDLFMTRSNLADVLRITGRLEEGASLYSLVLPYREVKYGTTHWRTQNSRTGLLRCLIGLGRLGDAAIHVSQSLTTLRAAPENTTALRQRLLTTLAGAQFAADHIEDAVATFQELLETEQETKAFDDRTVVATRAILLVLHVRLHNRASKANDAKARLYHAEEVMALIGDDIRMLSPLGPCGPRIYLMILGELRLDAKRDDFLKLIDDAGARDAFEESLEFDCNPEELFRFRNQRTSDETEDLSPEDDPFA